MKNEAVPPADVRSGGPAESEWYTLKEVAAALGVSRQAVHARITKGQLPGEQVQGVWRVPGQALVAAVEAKRREALSLGSVRVLPAAAPATDGELVRRVEALEALVEELREEHQRSRVERDAEVAALEERCARLQSALHHMVDLLGSAQTDVVAKPS